MKKQRKSEISILPGFEITAKDGSGIHLLVIFEMNTSLQKIFGILAPLFRPNEDRILPSGSVRISTKSIDEIKKILDDSGEDYIFIFAHADRENGVLDQRTITGQRRIEEWHKEYIKICQLAKPIDNYSSGFIYNVITGIDVNYRKDMTYIISSDCRSIETSNGRQERFYLGEKSVWIKSDPNLQGLKQIIYEPSRVYFGEEPPNKTEKSKIIERLRIINSRGWFTEEDIEFNENQVSIIGGKGTGKTAILDLIAYATRSLESNDPNCFINRALKELIGTKIEVYWKSGQKDEIVIAQKLQDPLPVKKQKVKYLTQSFVEQLCDYKNVENLTKQIENIIFQNLPISKKAEYLDFQEYRSDLMRVLKNQQDRNVKSLKKLSKELFDKISIVDNEKEMVDQANKIKSYIVELKKEYKKLKEKEPKAKVKGFEKIEKLNKTIISKEAVIGKLNKKLLVKEEILNDIDVFLEDSNSFVNDLKKKLKVLGVRQTVIDKIKVSLLPQNLNLVINQRLTHINKKIKDEDITLGGFE